MNSIKTVLTVQLLFCSLMLSAQLASISIESGITSSDVRGSVADEAIFDNFGYEYNSRKNSFHIGITGSYQIWKNISVDATLTYQERLPLDYFELTGK